MSKIYEGDVGVQFVLDTGQDLDDSTKRELHVMKPSGAEVVWAASIYDDPITGNPTQCLTYISVNGDLDLAGVYKIQAYVEWGPGSKHLGDTVLLDVRVKYN
jgi:hypothetical protein